MAPHLLRLAQIDERRFINACRHGLVHLTWRRVTVRLTQDEFRHLARLLSRSAEPLGWARDGEMQVTCSDQDCEIQLGPLKLVLSLNELREFGQAAQAAVQQLDKILDSGMWDEEEPADAPPSILERLRGHSFSEN